MACSSSPDAGRTHPVLQAASRREPPLSAWHWFGAEPDRIRRARTGSHDVWPAVAVTISIELLDARDPDLNGLINSEIR